MSIRIAMSGCCLLLLCSGVSAAAVWNDQVEASLRHLEEDSDVLKTMAPPGLNDLEKTTTEKSCAKCKATEGTDPFEYGFWKCKSKEDTVMMVTATMVECCDASKADVDCLCVAGKKTRSALISAVKEATVLGTIQERGNRGGDFYFKPSVDLIGLGLNVWSEKFQSAFDSPMWATNNEKAGGVSDRESPTNRRQGWATRGDGAIAEFVDGGKLCKCPLEIPEWGDGWFNPTPFAANNDGSVLIPRPPDGAGFIKDKTYSATPICAKVTQTDRVLKYEYDASYTK